MVQSDGFDTKIKPNSPIDTEQPKRPHLIGVGIFIAVVSIVAVVLVFMQFRSPIGSGKTYTIGVTRYVQQLSAVEDGFFKGMENLGYKEGKNVRYIITPYTATDGARAVAQGLIDQNVDMIVAVTNVSATGAKKATEASGRTDIPIVFTHASSPDATGLIKSFKSSGNHLTGVAINLYEVTEKKLEFLRRINPSIKKIGILDTVEKDAGLLAVFPELQKSVAKFGMELIPYKVYGSGAKASEEIATIAKNIKSGEIDAFFHLPGPVSNPPNNIAMIIEMTKRLKIPSAYLFEIQVQQGGLFSYAPDPIAMGEQTAVFVDKVLNGRRPTDIPIEFPKKNTLSINMATARATAITIPESMLLIADTKFEK